MSPNATGATALRVFAQLRRDPRTIALLMLVPVVLITLLKYMFVDTPAVFDRVGAPLLGLFPFISMFLITSITMLRERTSGTLERLMALPPRSSTFCSGTASRSLPSPPRRRQSSRWSRSGYSTSTPLAHAGSSCSWRSPMRSSAWHSGSS